MVTGTCISVTLYVACLVLPDFCDRLIVHPEEFYRVYVVCVFVFVSVYDLETAKKAY